MTTLIRPLAMTGFRQTLTLPTAGYSQTVQAYLWGAGGGAGGSDGPRLGGSGTGGAYVSAEFTVNPGDVVELTVGSAGWSGRASSVANEFSNSIFSTRTAVPIGRTTALPDASTTYVSRWSQFLNQNGVWNTGTALDGTTTSLADTLNFDQSYSVNFPFTIDYLFNFAAYYEAKVYLDGELLFESGVDSWRTQESGGVPFIANVTAGVRTLRIVANANAGASYGLWGVGLTIANTTSAGSGGLGLVRDIFNTRDTVASPPLTIPDINILFQEGKVGSFSNLMNDYGMWEATPRATSCSRSYTVYFPYTGVYQIQMSAANTATLSIDGTPVYTTPGSTSYTTAYTVDYTVSQGYHTVSFSATLSDPTIIGGVAILISKSWSGATGGLAGPTGSSGGGGGSGGATTLVLNPRTVNETLLAVAVGGAGGGGAGNSTTGISQSTAPGPRGRTAAGVSSPQTGQSQGDLYKDGGGGGAGGPGGPGGAGRNGYSSVGDSYGQAGSLGLSYLNPIASGQVTEPSGTSVAFKGPYYNLLPEVGRGAVGGELQAKHGGAVFIFNSFGPRVKTDAGWQEVKTIFVNVDGVWKQIDGMYVNENGVWEPVVGTFVPTFEPQSNDFGILARPSDHREIPPPPPKVYDAVPRTGCFVQGTTITMANGSTKSIQDVAVGDQLLGNDGVVNTVLECVRPTLGNRTLVSFNGQAPFMTSDHPVLTTGGSWKSVNPDATNFKYPELADLSIGQLAVGDVIVTKDHTGFEIVSIEEHVEHKDLQLYNFALDGNNTYVANNLVVHNKGCSGTPSTSVSCSCSAGGGGGGGGGSCFTEDTLVAMADGTTKPISQVKVGDQVYNHDRTKINRVLFIEQAKDSEFGFLYSPDQQHRPFATFNHPLYINGKLSTVDPDYMYDLYPWFGHTELIVTDNTLPPQGVMTYNLWTDNDHTYIVNGYGTTSIVGDGGQLRLMVEQGLMSYERAIEVLISFVGVGRHIGYGLYILNNVSGKLNIRSANQLSAWVFKDDSKVFAKKLFFAVAKAIGVVACLFGPK